jgi:hypothetical protein
MRSLWKEKTIEGTQKHTEPQETRHVKESEAKT